MGVWMGYGWGMDGVWMGYVGDGGMDGVRTSQVRSSLRASMSAESFVRFLKAVDPTSEKCVLREFVLTTVILAPGACGRGARAAGHAT